MSFPLAVLTLVLELLALSLILLGAHYLRPRLGLTPLLVVIGGLTGALQFQSMAPIPLQIGAQTLNLHPGSVVFLPMILSGLLSVYVVEGTTQARTVLLSIVAMTLLAALLHFLPTLQNSLGLPAIGAPSSENAPGPRILLASAVAFTVDLFVLVIMYQWVSNMLSRHPSHLAAGLALAAALWCDALLFALISYAGTPVFWARLLTNLLGKTLSAAVLVPLAMLYFTRFMHRFPGSAASLPRPALDIFVTSAQWEERARYQNSLLRTLLEINNLVGRAVDVQSLFDQAGQLLVAKRNYSLVWIHLDSPVSGPVQTVTQKTPLYTTLFDPLGAPRAGTAAEQVMETGEFQVISNQRNSPAASGGSTLGIFPLRQDGTLLGSLGVVAARANAFDDEEVSLLQELADDLANAATNLALRQQQNTLFAAAETMLDGLQVVDLNGKILYANAAARSMLPMRSAGGPHQHISDFLDITNPEIVLGTYRQALLERGNLSAEFELKHDDAPLYLAVRASLIYNLNHEPAQVVISARDVTRRRQYEHQLLTLNRLVTEFVQIREPEELLRSILSASVELMQGWASAIFLVDADQRTVKDYLTHNLPEEYARRIAQSYTGLPGETVAKTMRPAYVSDTMVEDSAYGDRLRFMADFGVRALLILPVVFQEQPFGAMAIYYNQPHAFTDDDIQLGLTLSHTLAIAVQNARLYQSEHSQRQWAEALAQAAAGLNRFLDLDDVLDQILEQVQRVTACRSANIMLIEGEIVRMVRTRGYEGMPEHVRAGGEQGVRLSFASLQKMLKTRQPVLMPDTEQERGWTPVEGTEWIRSYAGAPLRVGDQVVGFLGVDSEQPNFMTQETMYRLQALADHAATAIQNARLYSQLQSHASNLETRVRERTAELKAAKDRIEGILASVPDAVFVLNEQNQPIHANQAGEALMLQALAQELELFSEKFIRGLSSGLLQAEDAVLEAGGRAYQALVSPFPADQGRPGLVVAFRDVTRFRELDQMKTRFVSDVSHELRTPLTNLMLYLDLLATSLEDPRKSASYLSTLRRETRRLSHLIEDLLMISRLESKRLVVHLKEVDVNRLLDDLAADRGIMAQRHSLTLQYTPTPDLPIVMADVNLLSQAISNLLTNAISYTPAGGTVTLSSGMEHEGDANWVTIHVVDTGVGIAQEELPLIFDRFFRGSASRQTGAPGTGLGLAISRELIMLLDGRLTVESTLQVGSTFTIWLKAVL